MTACAGSEQATVMNGTNSNSNMQCDQAEQEHTGSNQGVVLPLATTAGHPARDKDGDVQMEDNQT